MYLICNTIYYVILSTMEDHGLFFQFIESRKTLAKCQILILDTKWLIYPDPTK